MDRIACIVGGVKQSDYIFPEGAFIIAADLGYKHLKDKNITPDLAVGDFDSLGFVPTDVPVIRHPVRKDDTDTLLAAREGLSRGYKIFILYGCIGGARLDHTLANLQTLAFIAENGAVGFMTDGVQVITAIKNSTLSFDASERGTVSVFCIGADAQGVSIEGLEYPLNNVTLTASMPLGVSNAFTGEPAFISVRKGTLCILWRKPIEELLNDLK